MLKLGEKNIAALRRGDAEIVRACLGDKVVFEKAKQPPRLPDGYTELKYISNGGTSYANNFGVSSTDIANKRFEISVKLLDTSKNQAIFGGYYSYRYVTSVLNSSRSNKSDIQFISSDNNIAVSYGYHSASTGGFQNVTIPYTTPELHIVLDVKKSLFSVNGQEASITSGRSMTNAVTPSLFARNYSWTSKPTASSSQTSGNNKGNIPANMEFYYFKVYNSTADETGDLVHHYVPAKRNSDGKIGIFDIVASKFYLNDGTDEFTAGPAV